MIRGGSWNNNANNCRAANRNRNNPDNRNNNNGFRVCSAGPAQETGRMSLAEPDDACILPRRDGRAAVLVAGAERPRRFRRHLLPGELGGRKERTKRRPGTDETD